MFEFAWPLALALLVLPWLLRGRPPWLETPPALLMPCRPDLGGSARPFLLGDGRVPKAMAWVLWLCLVVALARPVWLEVVPVQGKPASGSLLIILDISASMDAEDLLLNGKPASRLTVAKTVAAELIQNLNTYRAGMIVFGSEAHVHTPITRDKAALLDGLPAVQSGVAGRGSSLDGAIALATSRLSPGDEPSLIVVLSDDASKPDKPDGNKDASPEPASRRPIHALLMAGTPRGTHATSSAESRLQGIAESTGGTFAQVVNGEALRTSLEIISRAGGRELGQTTVTRWREIYPWPLSIALLISIALALHAHRRVGA